MRRLPVIAAPIALALLAACGGSDTPAVNTPSASSSGTSDASSPSTGPSSSAAESPAGQSSGSAPASSTETTGSSAGAKDPKTIVDTSLASARKADSGRALVTTRDEGQTLTIDIRGTVDGSNQEAVVTHAQEGKITLRTVDGTTYMLANRKFWAAQNAPAAQQKALDGKWVRVPASQKSNFSDTTLKSLLDSLAKESGAEKVTSSNSTVVSADQNGKPVLRITGKGSSAGTVLVVADDEKHLPIELSDTGSDGGNAKFSEWNSVGRVSAPPASDVIDAPTR